MDYIIAGSVTTDEIHLSDGTVMANVPGGAGIYALAGARLWTEKALIASGIGPEYLTRHAAWYEANGIPTTGLVPRGTETPTTVITYFPGGDRLDAPNLGLAEFRKMDPTPEEISHLCTKETKGVYVFRDWDEAFWAQVLALKQKYGFRLMWEISEDACTLQNLRDIKSFLPHVDVFSMNRKEAGLLCGGLTSNEAAKQLAVACGGWVYLRRGKDGAAIYTKTQAAHCPSAPNVQAMDVTGAGNASSAAVLYACCEGASPSLAAAMGSVAAAHIIAQFGPPAHFTEEMRAEALCQAEQLATQTVPEDIP